MNGLDQLAQFPTVFWFRNPIFNFGANWRIKYRFGAECQRNVGIQAVFVNYVHSSDICGTFRSLPYLPGVVLIWRHWAPAFGAKYKPCHQIFREGWDSLI